MGFLERYKAAGTNGLFRFQGRWLLTLELVKLPRSVWVGERNPERATWTGACTDLQEGW